MYAFFHHLPPAGLHLILLLFNLIWYKGQLPKAWKHAIVLPILKAGKQPNSPLYNTIQYNEKFALKN